MTRSRESRQWRCGSCCFPPAHSNWKAGQVTSEAEPVNALALTNEKETRGCGAGVGKDALRELTSPAVTRRLEVRGRATAGR